MIEWLLLIPLAIAGTGGALLGIRAIERAGWAGRWSSEDRERRRREREDRDE